MNTEQMDIIARAREAAENDPGAFHLRRVLEVFDNLTAEETGGDTGLFLLMRLGEPHSFVRSEMLANIVCEAGGTVEAVGTRVFNYKFVKHHLFKKADQLKGREDGQKVHT